MIEAFVGAFLGAMIGVVVGAYLNSIDKILKIVKSAKDTSKITETKIIDGYKVTFIYEN